MSDVDGEGVWLRGVCEIDGDVDRVGGKVAAVGQRMLARVTQVLIAEFFDGLNAKLSGVTSSDRGGLVAMVLRALKAMFRGGGR